MTLTDIQNGLVPAMHSNGPLPASTVNYVIQGLRESSQVQNTHFCKISVMNLIYSSLPSVSRADFCISDVRLGLIIDNLSYSLEPLQTPSQEPC